MTSITHDTNLVRCIPLLGNLFPDGELDIVNPWSKRGTKPDWTRFVQNTLWCITVNWKESQADADNEKNKPRVGDERWIVSDHGVVNRVPAGYGLLWIRDMQAVRRIDPLETCLDVPTLQSAWGRDPRSWLIVRELRKGRRVDGPAQRKPNVDDLEKIVVGFLDQHPHMNGSKLSAFFKDVKQRQAFQKLSRQGQLQKTHIGTDGMVRRNEDETP